MKQLKNGIIRTSLLGIVTLISCLNFSCAQSKADKINELVSTYAKYGKLNGAVLVAEEGKVIYKKAFGFANMEWGIQNSTDSKFRLGSVSKQFTAMLIMQLVAEKKLDLNTAISNYLPNYPKKSANLITIHHLLTHSSGIPNYTSFPSYRKQMHKFTRTAELVRTFSDSTLLFMPGTKFKYSNSGYVLLGFIMEKVTGKTYQKLLEEKIFSVLKMKNSVFSNNRDILKKRVVGYNKNFTSFGNSNYIDMSVAFSAGGLYSSVEDLFLWDQALYTEKLLPKKYMKLIFDKQIAAWGEHYGYGWIIGETGIGNTKGVTQSIKHDGVINGFSSLILRIPSTHSSIIILNNTGGAPLNKITRAINGILHGGTYDLPKKSFAHSLLEIIEKEGMAKALQFYEQVKNTNEYYLDENELNMLSYKFLQSNNAKLAANVLELAIEIYPNAFNLYDSYGEVLATLGRKKEAIRNYKKSLKLNPRNKNAIRMLRKLGISINPEDLYLLKTDKSWKKEIFTFPLRFAKGLNYEGIEEAHFPKGWRKQESGEFWSYLFAWKIKLEKELSRAELEENLKTYFDGLMAVVNKDKKLTLAKSLVKLDKENTSNGLSKYKGTVHTFDAFVTKKALTLNVLVETRYCEEKKTRIVVFRFSPQAFGKKIWYKLKGIKLRGNICKN